MFKERKYRRYGH